MFTSQVSLPLNVLENFNGIFQTRLEAIRPIPSNWDGPSLLYLAVLLIGSTTGYPVKIEITWVDRMLDVCHIHTQWPALCARFVESNWPGLQIPLGGTLVVPWWYIVQVE